MRIGKNEELVVRLHAEIRALQLENDQLKQQLAAKPPLDSTGAAAADAGYAGLNNPFNSFYGTAAPVPGNTGQDNSVAPASGSLTVTTQHEPEAAAEQIKDEPKPDIMSDDFSMVADFDRHMQELRESLTSVSKERDQLLAQNQTLQEQNQQLTRQLQTAEEHFFKVDDTLAVAPSPGISRSGPQSDPSTSSGAADLEIMQLMDRLEFMEHREKQLQDEVTYLRGVVEGGQGRGQW